MAEEECITIDSSDGEDLQVVEAPVDDVKNEFVDDAKRKVPLRTIDTGKSVFGTLLNTCKNADSTNDMDVVVNKMWKRFHQAESSYTSSPIFIEFVKKLLSNVSTEPYSQLKAVSDELKFHTIKATKRSAESDVQNAASSVSNNCSNIDRKTQRNIEKLEKIVAKLHKKIAQLESQEVDLDNSSDEENSAYLQVSRYKNRICDVFKKLCELKKTASMDDCLRANIKFSGTKISAVNRAIEKYYNDQRQFPDFRDVLLIVEKANEMKDLKLSSVERQSVAVHAFKELGETLKRQRQYEFHCNLTSYIGDKISDPASENPVLEQKLEENKKIYGNRIDEIIDKYALKQTEENLEPEEVLDDVVSESDEIEEEEEEDISSVGEMELNDNDASSAEENEFDSPLTFRDLKVVLPDLQEDPEWNKFCQKRSTACETSSSSCKSDKTSMCQPIPGCSKDIVNDFCLSCSQKEHSRTVEKRKWSESSEKNDSESETLAKKMFKSSEKDPLADDGSDPERSDVVSLEPANSFSKNGIRIVSVVSKNTNNEKHRIDQKNRESNEDVEHKIMEESKNKSNPVAKNFEVIDLEKIPDVNSVSASTMSKLANQKSAKNVIESSSESSSKSGTFSRSRSNLANKMPHNYHKRTEDNHRPWSKPSPNKNKFLATSTPKANVSQPKPNMWQSPVLNSPHLSGRRMYDSRVPNAGGLPRHQNLATSSSAAMSHHRMYGAPFPANRNSATGIGTGTGNDHRIRGAPGPHTAVAKRTMQTTQKIVKGNNVFTQTTTVVQESVMQLSANIAHNKTFFNRNSNSNESAARNNYQNHKNSAYTNNNGNNNNNNNNNNNSHNSSSRKNNNYNRSNYINKSASNFNFGNSHSTSNNMNNRSVFRFGQSRAAGDTNSRALATQNPPKRSATPFERSASNWKNSAADVITLD